MNSIRIRPNAFFIALRDLILQLPEKNILVQLRVKDLDNQWKPAIVEFVAGENKGVVIAKVASPLLPGVHVPVTFIDRPYCDEQEAKVFIEEVNLYPPKVAVVALAETFNQKAADMLKKFSIPTREALQRQGLVEGKNLSAKLGDIAPQLKEMAEASEE